MGLEVTSLSCNHILSLDDRAESQLVNDTLYNYPIGLLDFELGCTLPGASATVRVFFDADYSSTSNTWVFRKWDGTQWLTVSPQPVIAPYTFVTGPLSGMTVTTVTYSQTDGGNNDSDNSLNSTIRDPIGPAVLAPIVTPLPSGGGGGGG